MQFGLVGVGVGVLIV